MTITARNYAAQFEKDLLQSRPYSNLLTPKEIDYLKELASIINDSTHFAIPDGAKLLNDRGAGLVGQEIKLPFKNITVEYWSLKYKTKYVAVAFEVEGLGICVTGGHYNSDAKSWDVCLSVSLLAQTVESGGYIKPGKYRVVLPSIRDLVEYSNEQCSDLAAVYCIAVVELIEALSCRNITTEPLKKIDPKINAKRIKAGKLPLYETKILVLKTPQTIHQSQPGKGTHASPRQHLRRGHIRRLPKGNIWVNSCVVGDPSKGKIKKSYQVTRGNNGD